MKTSKSIRVMVVTIGGLYTLVMLVTICMLLDICDVVPQGKNALEENQ